MLCPRCQQGLVCKADLATPALSVYCCNCCDALWTHPQAIGPFTFVSRDLFLQTHGLPQGINALGTLDATWSGEDVYAAAHAAVQTNPDDALARLQLGLLLLESTPADALEQFAAILLRDPAHNAALQHAAKAAELCGEHARADGYRRLWRALTVDHSSEREKSPEVPANNERKEPVVVLDRQNASHLEGGDRPRLRVVDKEESPDTSWQAERSIVTLADVAGMEHVKKRLQIAFLAPLQNPELRKMYGKSLRGGLLLYGPPGCGKTFIARATAGELGAKFISVGISDVLDMWIGESERHLHEIFETARRNAPSVLFFDEIDALGQKRSQLRHHAGIRNLVNQLLAELDGSEQRNNGVFILGATNHPWDIDSALLRPGRFDRMVLVLPPDELARKAVLQLHLEERPTEALDFDWIAARCQDFSGADLAHLCESAVEIAMESAVTTGQVRPIGMADFKSALKDVRPSTRPWFDTARNYVMFANGGGIYDELLQYMRTRKLLS